MSYGKCLDELGNDKDVDHESPCSLSSSLSDALEFTEYIKQPNDDSASVAATISESCLNKHLAPSLVKFAEGLESPEHKKIAKKTIFKFSFKPKKQKH